MPSGYQQNGISVEPGINSQFAKPSKKTRKRIVASILLILLIYIGSYLALRISGRIAVLPPWIYGNGSYHIFGVAAEEDGPLREDLRITYAFYPLCKIEEAIRNKSARTK